jgi:hypothetical protein
MSVVKLEELNDLEQMYIVDGLEAMLRDKRAAFEASVQLAKEAGIKQPFSDRDFGIPAIESLKARFNETFYGPEEESECQTTTS